MINVFCFSKLIVLHLTPMDTNKDQTLYINAKWLVQTKAYLSESGAKTALHKCRKALGIKPYGKITKQQWDKWQMKK